MPKSHKPSGMNQSQAGKTGMWTLSTQSLQTFSQLLLWVTAIAGGVAVVTGFLSTVLANKASDAIQAEADKRIAEANATATTATVRVEEARTEAARLTERAAQLEKDAAEARLEQERLKALVAWRPWSPAQAARLEAAVRGSRAGVLIEYDSSDTETRWFAINLGRSFEAAGWQVGLTSGTTAGAISFGLFAPNGPQPSTDVVRRGLAAAGVPFVTDEPPPFGMAFGGGPQGAARVRVGSRPVPLLAPR